MSTPCGIFWDYGNIEIPKKLSADDVNNLIRSAIIEIYDLVRKDYYIVGDKRTIKPEIVEKFQSFGATFENVVGKQATDGKIINRMVNFIDRFQQKCTIILISGDLDIGKPLKEYKSNDLLKIYIIRLENSFSDKLESIADRVFLLSPNKSLEAVQPRSYLENQSGSNQINQMDSFTEFMKKYFVMIESDQYFTPKLLDEIRNDLSSYGGSFAILTDDDVIWCSFDEISDARSALNLTGQYNYNSQVFYLDVKIEKPSLKVNNLMMCAKLSNRQLVTNQRAIFTMTQYKVNECLKGRRGSENTAVQESVPMNDWMERINNMSDTYNNVQSIFSTLKSPNPRTNTNRPSNSRSNDEGCRQS